MRAALVRPRRGDRLEGVQKLLQVVSAHLNDRGLKAVVLHAGTDLLGSLAETHAKMTT